MVADETDPLRIRGVGMDGPSSTRGRGYTNGSTGRPRHRYMRGGARPPTGVGNWIYLFCNTDSDEDGLVRCREGAAEALLLGETRWKRCCCCETGRRGEDGVPRVVRRLPGELSDLLIVLADIR